MSEVVHLQPREPGVYVCLRCSNTTWRVLENFTVECGNCGQVIDKDVGVASHARVSRIADDVKLMTTTTFADGDETDSLAWRRICKGSKPGNTAALIIVDDNGGVRTWGTKFDTKDRKSWLRQRLRTAFEMLC